MTQLDRSVAPAIRQLEHFSILQPELHRMKNGMPLYVLSAGNEDVIRFDLLVRSGQLDQPNALVFDGFGKILDFTVAGLYK